MEYDITKVLEENEHVAKGITNAGKAAKTWKAIVEAEKGVTKAEQGGRADALRKQLKKQQAELDKIIK